MKIDKLSALFGAYKPAAQSANEQSESLKTTNQQDAAKVSVSSYEESSSARAEKIKQLKDKHDSGTLRYDSEKVAVALVRDLGI